MLSDKEWEEFYQWCRVKFPMWSPSRTTIRLYLEWLENKKNEEA